MWATASITKIALALLGFPAQAQNPLYLQVNEALLHSLILSIDSSVSHILFHVCFSLIT